nr:Hydroxyproline-rich glycoprotein family protein [Ipomoea batatas]
MVNEGSSSSRSIIAFPLGLGLLGVVLICITGFFSCCYHWDKLRSLFVGSSTVTDSQLSTQSSVDVRNNSPPKPIKMPAEAKQEQSMTILMPGDDVPKFVAMPTPLHKGSGYGSQTSNWGSA